MLRMADLLAMLAEMGFSDGRSLLQSGNLLFRAEEGSAVAIEAAIEAAILRRFGKQIRTFVRTREDLESVLTQNPFREEARSDPGHMLVMFLAADLSAAELAKIQASVVGREKLALGPRLLYITYPDGIGDSKLKLKLDGTARNWNTLNKLVAMASDD